MRSLLRSAVGAGRVVGDRSDAWIPGALASLAFVAWLPFMLAVVPLPTAADVAFFGADLYTSSRWPLNAVQLLAGVGIVVLVASVLVALGEATLLRTLRPGPAARTLADDGARVWLIQLVAALPAVAASAVLMIGIAAVAPGEYQSPDIGGPLELRIARDVAPVAVLLLIAILLGQALGAAATWHAFNRPVATVAESLNVGLRQLLHAPARLASVAIATLVAQAVGLLVAYGLLVVLWSPIGLQLGRGQLGGPQTLLLLVGFVAIWLCLLIGVGALHAWASAWWTLELDRSAIEDPEPAINVEGIGQA